MTFLIFIVPALAGQAILIFISHLFVYPIVFQKNFVRLFYFE